MKKFFKNILLICVCCCMIMFSGCFVFEFDENNPSSQQPADLTDITNFKVCYSDNDYQIDKTFEIYANFILKELYASFGLPNTQQNTSNLTTKVSLTDANFDRIRMQVNVDNSINNTPWKWTFSKSMVNCNSQETVENSNAYYTDEKQEIYYNTFLNTYSIPLQIVCMQIIMGNEPYNFTIQTNVAGNPIVYYGSSIISKNSTNVYDSVVNEFQQKVKYIGFTPENTAKFKQYIMQNVIGDNLTSTSSAYNQIYLMDNTSTTYSLLIDKILALDAGLEQSFYTPFPAEKAKDVTDLSFYPSSNASNPLSHIDQYEYHNLVFMPKKSYNFLFLMELSFQANADTALTVYFNYYNHQEKTSKTIMTKNITIKGGAFSSKNDCEFLITNTIDLPAFDNSKTTIASASNITNQNKLSTQFTYSNSRIGFDTDKAEQDFFEISFVPQKSGDEYCPFKFAICTISGGFDE